MRHGFSNNYSLVLEKFCLNLGYTFVRSELLLEALTHRSHSALHNERLEFLGDAVLNCAIAGLIYKSFSDLSEGYLSRMRASLVNQQALSEMALNLQLDQLIRLGEGELKSGGCHRPSILADAFEAVLGAIYLDSDFTQAESVITKLYDPWIQKVDLDAQSKDPKSQLQEFLQSQPNVLAMLGDIQHYIEKWLPSFVADNRSYLTVAIGCTGGQHRSVYFVETLSAYFRPQHKVLTRHRELKQ